MKILILCGVFAEENEEEIIKNATAPVEFSANLFQKRLIDGFLRIKKGDVQVLSAPFIGAFPTGSKMLSFKRFEKSQNKYKYVPFNNIWGYRNFSRKRALTKALNSFIEDKDDEKLLVVYSAHTPFIKSAKYAKSQDPRIKVCLYVPDLPQYMNLSAKRGFIYNVGKKYDIASMTKSMDCVDSFVLLTSHMKELLPVGEKSFSVIEGIFDSEQMKESSLYNKESQNANDVAGTDSPHSENDEKYIVYTGKLDKRFGVVDLIDSMKWIKEENVKLVLCGNGDSFEYALEESKHDKRILPLGQVKPAVAEEWRNKASVLINPRPNTEEYTKYSFPSKNVEYLLSGKPTVAYMLDGMPREYKNFIYEISPDGEASSSIAKAVTKALNAKKSETAQKSENYHLYAANKLSADKIALQIIDLNFNF